MGQVLHDRVGVVAVVLDDQRAADVLGELERRGRCDVAHGRAVHQLAGAREEAGAEDLLHAQRRGVLVREESQHGGDRARQRDQFQRRFHDDRKRAFAADEKLRQIVSGDALPAAVAGLDQFAGRQHRFDAEHVIARHAIFQGARPAGVVGQVSADRADRL